MRSGPMAYQIEVLPNIDVLLIPIAVNVPITNIVNLSRILLFPRRAESIS